MIWLLFVACQQGRVSELETQLSAVQDELSTLQQSHDAVTAQRDALEEKLDICRSDPSEVDRAAVDIYEQMIAAQRQWDATSAREALHRLQDFYPHTNAGRIAERTAAELDVMGMPAVSLEGVQWLNTAGSEARVTVLVFFEEWCPLCREDLPVHVEKQAQLAAQGIALIGLTEINRTSTAEKVRALLDTAGATFPVGQVPDRTIHDAYNVTGIPAAAVVVDGVVVWRGNSRLLDWERVAQVATP